MESVIRSRLASIDGDCAVAVRSLDEGSSPLLIRANERFHAASTMKTPVMVELYRQAHAGRIDLDDRLRIENTFRSIVDGSHYSLDPQEDSHTLLYDHLGEKHRIRDLIRAMIVESSNLATNLLIDTVGPKAVTQTMRRLGADGIHVRRGVEDTAAYERGLNNETTAASLLVLFEHVARGTAVSEPACDEMIQILKQQTHRDILPAHLPHSVEVAHKSGWISGVRHDSGIVFVPEGPTYVLVLLSKNLSDVEAGGAALADISRLIYDRIRPTSG